MEDLRNKTVAEIVTDNIKTSDIFKRNGIDFCCGGNVNVTEICKKQGVDYSEIERQILSLNKNSATSFDYNSWELDFLIDFIVNTHHKYVSESSPLLIEYSDKVESAHGESHPEVIEIKKLSHALVAELAPHMMKEELILFPYIKKLVASKKENSKIMAPGFGTVQGPISAMESEHDSAGDILKEIARLSNNYTPPEEACNTYKALYSKLEEFQNDLFQHIHLENNILFPKAISLEQELL